MKNLIKKLQEEIADAKDRMISYDDAGQKANSDVELGVARGLNMALDLIKEKIIEDSDNIREPSKEDWRALDQDDDRFQQSTEENEI